MNRCMLCGRNLDSSATGGICYECKHQYNNSDTININTLSVGWICPKCGKVYAPFVESCIYCGPSIKYTYDGNAGSADD